MSTLLTAAAAVWWIPVVVLAMGSLAYWTEKTRQARIETERDAIAIVCGLIVPKQRNRRGGRS